MVAVFFIESVGNMFINRAAVSSLCTTAPLMRYLMGIIYPSFGHQYYFAMMLTDFYEHRLADLRDDCTHVKQVACCIETSIMMTNSKSRLHISRVFPRKCSMRGRGV